MVWTLTEFGPANCYKWKPRRHGELKLSNNVNEAVRRVWCFIKDTQQRLMSINH